MLAAVRPHNRHRIEPVVRAEWKAVCYLTDEFGGNLWDLLYLATGVLPPPGVPPIAFLAVMPDAWRRLMENELLDETVAEPEHSDSPIVPLPMTVVGDREQVWRTKAGLSAGPPPRSELINACRKRGAGFPGVALFACLGVRS